jgi:hypothetical protein
MGNPSERRTPTNYNQSQSEPTKSVNPSREKENTVEIKTKTEVKSDFWARTDRIAIMTAGGVALGGAVAQIPGAIILGSIAAGYGWYIGFGNAIKSK